MEREPRAIARGRGLAAPGYVNSGEHDVAAPDSAAKLLFVGSDPADASLVRLATARILPDMPVVVASTVALVRRLLAGTQDMHVVLVDLALPDGGGVELVRALRARWPAAPIVAIANTPDRGQSHPALRAGATSWVSRTKIGLDTLTNVIDVAVRSHRGARGASQTPFRVSVLSHRQVVASELFAHCGQYAAHVRVEQGPTRVNVARYLATIPLEQRPDVVLLDVGSDPAAAEADLAAVRDLAGGAPPIVVLSDPVAPELFDGLLRVGVAGFVTMQESFAADLLTALEAARHRSDFARDLAALRARELRYHEVVDHLLDAIIVEDRSGRIVFANAKFYELFAIPPERRARARLEDCVAPAWRRDPRTTGRRHL